MVAYVFQKYPTIRIPTIYNFAVTHPVKLDTFLKSNLLFNSRFYSLFSRLNFMAQ